MKVIIELSEDANERSQEPTLAVNCAKVSASRREMLGELVQQMRVCAERSKSPEGGIAARQIELALTEFRKR